MKQLTRSEFNKRGTTYKSVTSPATDNEVTQITDIVVKNNHLSYSTNGSTFTQLTDEVQFVTDLSEVYTSPSAFPTMSASDDGTVYVAMYNGELPLSLYVYNGTTSTWDFLDNVRAGVLYYDEASGLINVFAETSPYFRVASYTKTSQLTNDANFVNSTQLATKQNIIDSSNKLSADLVDDTSTTNKFVTTSEKSTWNAKQNALTQTQLDAVNSGVTSSTVSQVATNTTNIAAKYTKPSGGIPKTDLAQGVQDSLDLADSALQSISSSDVTTALGYTPYNSTNPNGYTKVESSSTNGNIKIDGSETTVYTLPNNVATTSDVTAVSNRVTTIEGEIPSQASSSNQLADKAFVNSSINALAAYYITKNAAGDPFATKAELTGASTFYSGGVVRAPTTNDYCIVLADESKQSSTGVDPTTRYSYQGNQWEYQYTINDTPLTAAQLAALNSGITSSLVTQIGTNTTDIAGKQDALSTAQMNAVNSGVTSSTVSQVATNTSNISGLQTSKQNTITSSAKLDADLVDDSTSTNKFVTSSDITAWNAKQSAIDSSNKLSADLVDDTNTTNKFVTSSDITSWNAKQNALTFDSTPTQNSTNPVTSGGAYTALAGKQDTLTAGTGITITNNVISSTATIDNDEKIQEISTQYIRITDLDAGVYRLTYNGTKYIYYNGATATDAHTVTGADGEVILVVSMYSTSTRHWYYINGSSSYASIYFGYTTSTAGNVSSKALNDVVTSATTSSITSGSTALITSGGVYTGMQNKMDKSNPTGTGSFSLNRMANTTIGTNSVAEGVAITASGDYSHAEGAGTTASGDASHAEGDSTTASGYCSHAEGMQTTASGDYSHAEGYYSTAGSYSSHAEGDNTTASGEYSHTEGWGTTAQSRSQHVFGEYNVLDTNGTESTRGTYVEIVGKGTAYNARSNARTLDWSGNEVLAGTLQATGFKDGNNASYKLVMPDSTSWTADKTIATTDQIVSSSTDVQVNGTSITSNNVANLVTNTAYNATSNKIATMSDIPTVNNATLTVQLNGDDIQTFTANASSNVTANIQALPNYSIYIGHFTAGNPRLVKFMSVNYTNYNTNSSAYFKLGAMSCHGNGSSYQFLEDIIVGVTSDGNITAQLYKYCQASILLDNETRYYGDVFYTHDTTAKVVDFYILCGQYASSQFTPFTPIGSTTTSGITQYSGTATYYSSGTKTWFNGCGTTYARKTDIPTTTSSVTSGSTDVLTSGGAYTALSGKQDSLTAGTGINITSNTISVTDPVLQNLTTNATSLTIKGTPIPSGVANSVNVGYGTSVGDNGEVCVGVGSSTRQIASTAVGFYASATKQNAIQLGTGTNDVTNTFNVGFRNVGNYRLLESTGKIPNDRLTLDTTPTSASTNAVTSGGVYTSLSGKQDTLIAGTGITITNNVISATGGGGSTENVYKTTKTVLSTSTWGTKTWNGLTNFNSNYIWTDGVNIYYSYGANQYVLDVSTSTWNTKTWNGLTNFYGNSIWTDGANIYCSYGTSQYVLNTSTSTWNTKTWNGLTNFYGAQVWTDGTNIYYSWYDNLESIDEQYVLNTSTSTWSTKTWNGLTRFDKMYIWTDGTNIYYSYGANQYVLNPSTSTWNAKTWNGLTNLNGLFIWTDGTNIYYSSGTSQYVLDKTTSTWSVKAWNGLTNLNGTGIWTDGTNIYINDTNMLINILLTKPKLI